MKTAFLTYTRKGCGVIRTIRPFFRQAECRSYTMERFGEQDFLSVPSAENFYKELFCWADVMIFVCSSGIAVRLIAPFLQNKCTDPAVICIDDNARFVIPLLAGHIGGANRTAAQLAEFLHAVPVITTATDGNGKFSVDAWAAENHCVIDNMENAKAVSAAILDCDVPLVCDFSIRSELPPGVVLGNAGRIGICISCLKRNPFQKTLRLIPKILHLGIGCRRGTPCERICEAVETVLNRYQIDERAFNRVATVDLKSNEKGLLEYCSQKNLPLCFFSAAELENMQGTFTVSPFVLDVTGVDNVCERAAMYEAEKLLVKKNVVNGVTVAVAAEPWEVCFE